MNKSIEIKNISFSYADHKDSIIKNLSLSFKANEISVIVGPSGCGKSTLLNLIAGIIQPKNGVINYRGLRTKSSSIGYVFQKDHLIPWQTVIQNCKFGAYLAGQSPLLAKQQAKEMLKNYGLSNFKNRYPNKLSAGMRQRISFIRAVLSGTDILLLDEPFSNLDLLIKQKLYSDIKELIAKKNLCIILVTHDILEAVNLADTVFIVSSSPMQIIDKVELPKSKKQKSCEPLNENIIPYALNIWNKLKPK